MITIWHNPRCSKSRQTLALLQEQTNDIIIREYLEKAPTEAELHHALSLLNTHAIAVMRQGEAKFKELGLSADDADTVLIAAMAAHPILIERPIVITKARAAPRWGVRLWRFWIFCNVCEAIRDACQCSGHDLFQH